jgi:hypothetical protein
VLRMDEHLAQVLPDQLVELAARRMTRSATLLGEVEIASSTVSLRLPKEESDGAFAALEKSLDPMTDDRLTEGRMRELVEGDGLPESFKNLLRIAAADSARRRGWIGLSEAAAGECTNGALLQVWNGWSARMGPP